MPMINPNMKRSKLRRAGRPVELIESYYLETVKNREEYRYDTMSDWDDLPISPKFGRAFLKQLGVSV